MSFKSLSSTLSKLEKNGIVERKVYLKSLIRIEYSLTKKDEDLKKLLQLVNHWDEKW